MSESANKGRLKSTWEVSAYDRKNKEWTTATNRSWTLEGVPTEYQAVAANITPTTLRKRRQKLKRIVVFGDAHIAYRQIGPDLIVPTHDTRAMEFVKAYCADKRPDHIVCLGDMVDFAELSKFRPDSDHFLRPHLTHALQVVHEFYAQLRCDCPKAKIVEIDSNHSQRIKSRLFEHLPQVYGIRRAGEASKYPLLTYPYLANLEAVGVEFVSGYPAAEYRIDGDIMFTHGLKIGKDAARKLADDYQGIHAIQGHTHKASSYFYTDYNGKLCSAHTCGVLCKITGEVPSAASAVTDENVVASKYELWTNSIIVIKYDESGYREFHHVMIGS